MKNHKLKIIIAVITVSFFWGCSTINTLDTTQKECFDRKKSSVFREDRILVFHAAEEVLKDLGFRIYHRDISKGRIYARSPELLPMLGLGEKVGVYVIYLDDEFTKVDVVLQKVFLLNFGYNDWRDKILNEINKYLKSLSEI